jgi:hypothetical protein
MGMATIIDSVSIEGLRKTHLHQLDAYIGWAEEHGIYYGPKDQFVKRHNDLRKWMDSVLEWIDDPNVKIARLK